MVAVPEEGIPSNDNIQLVKPGQEGELLIGGVCVAKGYIHAPELTAQVPRS